ncbi:class I SAM-dependent methyltransferase [Calycomorphotria hydatis]|uniref:C-methyltransferase domain-containing protein n=1 Tax=Calycomorphotria hydatis TaxID=2528027 RepID=A0A517T665_9PLAN|nr:class I SAM-dependent methyltransferase [Calycomorphotria hydatis]QDT63863.1 hypothetical protein V22_10880 [Calycomorphotria hydatis]
MNHESFPLASHCPICNSTNGEPFLHQASMPVSCHHLHTEQNSAKATPCGEIELYLCHHCGLIYNRKFDPNKFQYQAGYENAQHFSARFREYLENLAGELTEQFGLSNKKIVELGCGDGLFLSLLCRDGANVGKGYDPSSQSNQQFSSPNVEIFPRYFMQDDLAESCDLICARHVLEHLHQPTKLLQLIREALLERRGSVYFEVPSAEYMLEAESCWDLIYEHCLYFTRPSMEWLLRSHGFDHIKIKERFGGQFLTVTATVGEINRLDFVPLAIDQLSLLRNSAVRFANVFTQKLQDANSAVARKIALRQRVAIGGAGTKGIMLLNFLQRRDNVSALVDINPRKLGKHIPGSGLSIISPDDPQLRDVDVVFMTNLNYEQEIRQSLYEHHLSPHLVAI